MTGPTSRYGGYPPPRIPVDNIDGSIPGSRISGDIADENVPGVRQTVNNIANKIFGWEGGERTHQESADALESIRFQMASNASQIQTILSTQTSGVMALDDFNRDASHLGTNWWTSYTGANFPYQCRTANGGEAYIPPLNNYGSVNATFNRIYIWQGDSPVSLTDYQDVALMLNGASSEGHTATASVPNVGHDVIARWSNNASYVRFRVLMTRAWELDYFLNGTGNRVASGTVPSAPGAGSILRIKAGDKEISNPRLYRAYFGVQMMHEWLDPGVTAVGSSNRSYGWGAWTNATGPGLPTVNNGTSPAPIDQWQAKDQ